MDYTGMYIGTIAMFAFSAVLIFSIYKVNRIIKIIKDRDAVYLRRLDSLEAIVKKDVKTILDILKG